MPTPRVRAAFAVDRPLLWVLLLYACGIAIRAIYTFETHPPERFIASDMSFYVTLAKRLASSAGPLNPWDVTHPLGYPMLLSFLISGGGSLARVAGVQFVVSCLVPPALGLLGAAAYGRRTGLLAFAFGTLYFPFIEYGALFLSEIHFIFWLALAFAALFAARRARRRGAGLALAAAGGATLSIAAAFKSVALPAAFSSSPSRASPCSSRARAHGGSSDGPSRRASRGRFARFKPWLLRGAVCALAAAPLLGRADARVHAREPRRVLRHREQGRVRLPARPLRPHRQHRMETRGPRSGPFRQPGRVASPLRRPRAGAVHDDRRPGQPCRGLALDRRAPG